jgi:hypothetical protein
MGIRPLTLAGRVAAKWLTKRSRRRPSPSGSLRSVFDPLPETSRSGLERMCHSEKTKGHRKSLDNEATDRQL